MKIRPKATKLEVRKHSFFQRVWKNWNQLPEKAVKAENLNKFKNRLMETRIFKDQ